MTRSQIHIQIKQGLYFPYNRAWLKSIIISVLKAEKLKRPYEIALAITDIKDIHELNKEYRKIDSPTDVLSFSLTDTISPHEDITFISPPDGLNHLGEIVIAYPYAVKQAHLHHNPIDQEMILLIIHGILHLLGYDHENEVDLGKMRKREKHILNLINTIGDTK